MYDLVRKVDFAFQVMSQLNLSFNLKQFLQKQFYAAGSLEIILSVRENFLETN